MYQLPATDEHMIGQLLKVCIIEIMTSVESGHYWKIVTITLERFHEGERFSFLFYKMQKKTTTTKNCASLNTLFKLKKCALIV